MKNLKNDVLKDKYKLIRVIGSGAMGIVGQFQNIFTSQKVAIKQLPAFEVEEIYLQEAVKEASVHKQLKHPNIVQIYESFKLNQHFYIVMQYCNAGNLETANIRDRFREFFTHISYKLKFVDELLYQLTKALYYLHLNHFIHRDVKPQNILLHIENNSLTLKLADFGCTKKQSSEFQETIVGTPEFQSPEQVMEQKYTNKIDIWGLGCVLFYLLDGDSPFLNKIHLLQVHFSRAKSTQLPANFTGKFRNILQNSLVKDPAQRLSAGEILQIFYDKRLEVQPRPIFAKRVKIGLFGPEMVQKQYIMNNFIVEFVPVTRTLAELPVSLICVRDLLLGSFQADYVCETGGRAFILVDISVRYEKRQLEEFMGRDDVFISSKYDNFVNGLISRLINSYVRVGRNGGSRVKSTISCFDVENV